MLVVNDYVEDLPEDRSAVREATSPESTALTRAGETWATLRDTTPPWAGVALPALALALAAVTRARRPREDRRWPSATPTPVGAESFDVSDLDLTPGRMEWWRDLPFVCVILFSSDQGGSQWFSVDMGEEGRRENRILGFESEFAALLLLLYGSLFVRVHSFEVGSDWTDPLPLSLSLFLFVCACVCACVTQARTTRTDFATWWARPRTLRESSPGSRWSPRRTCYTRPTPWRQRFSWSEEGSWRPTRGTPSRSSRTG